LPLLIPRKAQLASAQGRWVNCDHLGVSCHPHAFFAIAALYFARSHR
jgi:hypothetical protein